MRSEQQHIDDFFRKKEEAYQPDTGSMDGNWEQMKGLLKPSGDPAPKNYRLQTTRRIIKYLGGFTVVTVITLIWLNASRTAKKAPPAKAVAQKTATVAVNPKPAANKTASTKPAVTPTAIPVVKARIKKATTQPVKQKPVYQGTYTAPVNQQLLKAADKTPEAIKTDILPVAEELPAQSPDAAAAAKQLEAFYKALQKPAQEFMISTHKDTTIIGREGTRLTIPAQAFATRKKGSANGNVQIVLREYYTYEDILAAKLTTTFGDEQLESGGMVNISANVNGEEAGLKTGKYIKLEMPTANYDEEMQLFSGLRASIKPAFHAAFMNNTMIDTVHFMRREADEKGNIDWIPEGQSQRLPLKAGRKIKVFRLYNEPYKLVHGKKTKAYFYMSPASPYTEAEMKKKLLEHSNGNYDAVKVKIPSRGSKLFFWNKREVGPLVGDSVEMYFGQALKERLLSPEDSLRIVGQFREDSIREATRLKLMNQYTFSVGNLGWFNCDRFSRERGPRVLFTFNPGEGFEAAGMVSHLVFDRYRSVLPGTYNENKILFGRIPKDEPVKLVCLGIKNGRVMACIQSLNVTEAAISNLKKLAFEETTPEAFKKKLQTLRLSLP